MQSLCGTMLIAVVMIGGVTLFILLSYRFNDRDEEDVLGSIPETPDYMKRDDYLPGRDPVPFDDGHVQGRCAIKAVEPAALLVPNNVFDLEDPLPDNPLHAWVKPDWMKVLAQGIVRESKAKWN